MKFRTTKAFDRFLAGMEPEARAEAWRLLEREAAWIRSLPPGPERARAVHRRVNEAAARFAALKPGLMAQVRCSRGCGHCCRVWVGVTRDEAELLAEQVRAGAAQPDPGRLRAQAAWQEPADFMGKPPEQAACVFLGEDGACTVYEDRPAICRAVLVASDPEQCRDGGLETQVTAVLNPYVEVLVSAALSVDQEAAPTPQAGRHLAHELLGMLSGR